MSLVESAVVDTPEGPWMWVYVRGRGGVGRTLSPRMAARCAEDPALLLRVWRDLVGTFRRNQRHDFGRFGYGALER